MKKIDYRAKLNYETIGYYIDKYLSSDDCTLYNGKTEFFSFSYQKNVYHIEVIYQKSGLKFIVEEVK